MIKDLTQARIYYGMTRQQIAAKLQLNEHRFREILKTAGITHQKNLLPWEIEKVKEAFFGKELIEEYKL